jgi:DNA (cytosine-5)-methyltransferase 1
VERPLVTLSFKNAIREKLAILRAASPRVLDLFSGCGGLFLGFHREGCTSIGGVDVDPWAAKSYAINFHPTKSREADPWHANPVDIVHMEPSALLRGWGHAHIKESVDIVVGGPPCPAFTRVGRAKLRQVRGHPQAFLIDPRATLYRRYLDYVRELAPVALVVENVPEFLNHGGSNLGEVLCQALEELGYQCRYTILNAAAYGVPQLRERFILIAVHSEANSVPVFPKPTHSVCLPHGYLSSRSVALKLVEEDGAHFVAPPALGSGASAVTTHDAIADLPAIPSAERDKRGARKFDKEVAYRQGSACSAYARAMRDWPGFETRGLIADHVTRSLSERDYRLFRKMKEGDEYPAARALAERLFDKEQRRLARRGELPGLETEHFASLKAEWVPPYDPGKFPNRWRKLEWNTPARTLMAHLGKDGYSHIHPDPSEARVISVREAARLQSFPDGFVFAGSMNAAFRQIGNSVPPLLSHALAKVVVPMVRGRPENRN